MKKRRFWYWLFSLLVSLFALIYLTFFLQEVRLVYYFLIIIILLPNFKMKKTEKSQLMAIIGKYVISCDAKEYLKCITDFYNECYFSKKTKMYNSIIIAMINMDLGNFEEGKNILVKISEYVEKFPPFQKYTYYRAWTTYYYETGEAQRYKVLLDEMKRIVDNANGAVKLQMMSNYNLVEAKYLICENIFTDKAKNLFLDILSVNSSPLFRVSSHYYLGVIYYKNHFFDKAIEEFKYVSESEMNLYIVEKSKKYLQLIENHNNKS